jgi:tetratricopeptide (TPR) repeat protein
VKAVRIYAAVQSRPFNIAQSLQDALGLHRQGRLREAEKLYARVLKATPDNFDALHMLGLAKAQSGQMGEAFRLMSAALKIHAQAGDAWVNFANVLHALKRDEEALAAIDKALALRPGDAEVLHNRGNALLSLGRAAEALAAFDQVLAANPRHVGALLNRGVARASLQQTAEALADLDAALALAPGHAGVLFNRGTVLGKLGRYGEAIADLDRLLMIAPDNATAWNNHGHALRALNRHREAVVSFDKAIALDKDYGDAHCNRALSLLTLGDLTHGFAEFEWRWKCSGIVDTRRNYRGALWLGEYPLARKTILLHAEQGLGDTIQFARYAPLLKRDGASVILEVHPELKSLLASLAGIVSIHGRGEPLPPYDVHCPLVSLPLALKTDATNIPADIPYLRADHARIEKWRPVLASLPGKRVALTWAGNPVHGHDANRSIDLKLLEPLLALPGVTFVSLQRDLRAGDDAVLAQHGRVFHLGGAFTDMADTAAVLTQVDLSISVDTSVAHLAGALGRPCWVMLPFWPDWRWTLAGEHSPWYPRTRLFRQPALGDWPSAIATLRDALAQFIALS